MPILDKLEKKIERILLIGHTGHGKTYNSVRIALNLANKGKKVLYIDTEQGSLDEWEQLARQGKIDKNIDRNIILVHPEDFLQLKEYALGYQDKVDCIIIDPIRLNDFARITAKQKLLEKGIRYVGELTQTIEDKETFHLRGFDYQLPNEWQQELFMGLARGKVHFLVTELVPVKVLEEVKGEIRKKSMTINIDKLLIETDEAKLPKKLKELFDFMGWFDKVIACERTIVNGNKQYYGVIVKWRGKDISGEKIDNIYQYLLKNTSLLK